MKLYESAIVAGIAISGIYSLIAIGVTQIFRVTRVLNLAHAGFVLWGAYLYTNWAPAAPAVKHMPAIVAALLAVVCTAGIGVVSHFIVFRIARRATNIGKIIVTLGLFQVMLAAAIWIWGQGSEQATPLVANGYVSISKTNVAWSQLFDLGVALAIAIGYVLLLRFTRFGLLTRAVTEDPARAELLLGARRDAIGAFNWALAAGMGGFAGVLVCNLGPFTNDAFFTYYTVALLATMVGGLQSLPLTVIGAVVLSVLDTVVGVHFTALNASDAAIFAAFMIYILLRRRWPSEITQIIWTRPQIAREGALNWSSFFQWAFWISIAWIFLSIYAIRETVWATTADLTLVYAIAALSLVPILGWVGQVSLATPGLMGIGAFTMASLMTHHGVPMIWAILVALVVGAALSALLGLVTSRLGFVLTAVLSLAFTNASQWVMNSSLLQAAAGPVIIPLPGFLSTPLEQYALLVICSAVLIYLLHNVQAGIWGTRMIGTKWSPLMVQSFGENPARLRIYAYAFSGIIAAAAGILYSIVIGAADATGYTAQFALTILEYAVIGGVAVLWGPFIAALLFICVPQLFGLARFSGIPWVQLVLGLVVVGLVAVTSDGLVSLVRPPILSLPESSFGRDLARRLHVLPTLVEKVTGEDEPSEEPVQASSDG